MLKTFLQMSLIIRCFDRLAWPGTLDSSHGPIKRASLRMCA